MDAALFATARFWSKVDVTPKEVRCWRWRGSTTPDGYGHIRWGGRIVAAHRVAFELAKGPVPERCQVDHLCKNRLCCNPDHLEAVSQQENYRRSDPNAARRAATHCRRGHELSGDNLYLPPRGRRQCRACRRDSSRRYWASSRG